MLKEDGGTIRILECPSDSSDEPESSSESTKDVVSIQVRPDRGSFSGKPVKVKGGKKKFRCTIM